MNGLGTIVAAWQMPREDDYYVGKDSEGRAYLIPHVARNPLRRAPGYDGPGAMAGTPVPLNLIGWCADTLLGPITDTNRIGLSVFGRDALIKRIPCDGFNWAGLPVRNGAVIMEAELEAEIETARIAAIVEMRAS